MVNFKELLNILVKDISSLYVIEAYIPSDEKKVEWNIYKLQLIGDNKSEKYGFISINGTIAEGLGTRTNSWGKETVLQTLIEFDRIVNTENCTFILDGFEVALKIKDETVAELQKELKMNE
jgi:hypothetical protein